MIYLSRRGRGRRRAPDDALSWDLSLSTHLGQRISETPNEYNFKGRLFSPLKVESFENGLVKKKLNLPI